MNQASSTGQHRDQTLQQVRAAQVETVEVTQVPSQVRAAYFTVHDNYVVQQETVL